MSSQHDCRFGVPDRSLCHALIFLSLLDTKLTAPDGSTQLCFMRHAPFLPCTAPKLKLGQGKHLSHTPRTHISYFHTNCTSVLTRLGFSTFSHPLRGFTLHFLCRSRESTFLSTLRPKGPSSSQTMSLCLHPHVQDPSSNFKPPFCSKKAACHSFWSCSLG